MTEAEWLAWPASMPLAALDNWQLESDRELRPFTCACCRRGGGLLGRPAGAPARAAGGWGTCWPTRGAGGPEPVAARAATSLTPAPRKCLRWGRLSPSQLPD